METGSRLLPRRTCPLQIWVRQAAAEEQLVSALLRRGDAHAVAVDVVDKAQLRAGWHQVRRRDLEVGGGEYDLALALRLRPEERDVPGAGLDRVGQLAGGVEAD